VHDLQIDNHHPYTTFPVLLQPASAKQNSDSPMAPRASSMEAEIPCLLLNIVGVSTPHPNTYHFQAVSFGTKRLNLNVDASLLEVLGNFWKDGSTDQGHGGHQHQMIGKQEWQLPEEAMDVPPSANESAQVQSQSAAILYFELLRIKKLEFNLTVNRPRSDSENLQNVYIGIRPLKMLKDIIMRIDQAHISLERLVLMHETYSRDQLLSVIKTFYMNNVRKQIFMLLGHMQAFGNPMGLIRNVGKGAEDFIVEPLSGLAEGFEELRPDKIASGFARGTVSLVHHSVGGVANSAAMITDTFSDYVSNLALDKRYKASRDEDRERPTDFIEGLGSGGLRIWKGVKSGVTGVVNKPIQGARRKGVKGFAGGVLRGVAGLAVKPVVGVSDAVTDVFHGIKGTTENTFALQQRGQMRPKRACYGKEKAVRPYNLADAQAVMLLSQHKRFKHDDYVTHIDTGPSIVILTLQHIIDMAESGSIHQSTSLRDVALCEMQDDGVLVLSSTKNIKIFCSSKEQQIKIYHKIEGLLPS